MRIKNDYGAMNADLRTMIGEIKSRKRFDDSQVGKLIDLKGTTIRNYRSAGTLPNLPFCKVVELAATAGYQVKFERKED